MSVESTVRAVTTYRLWEMKQRREKIAMLTSYDYSMARIVDAAGVDVILVGDSAANVMAGYETTVPITLDMMIYHARSVARAVRRALVVVDLPFGTYQGNSKVALESAVRIMKETEADAVKIEGGEEILESVNRILSAGIPVMGHLGLTPQSIHKFGTYNVRAKDEEEAEKLVRDAHLLEDAGCFAIVLEKIPAALGTRVASELRIPIIGIGAGGGVDGQVLVIHDMLGINKGFSPRFLRRYADLHEVMTGAVTSYVEDVKSGDFPNESEQYQKYGFLYPLLCVSEVPGGASDIFSLCPVRCLRGIGFRAGWTARDRIVAFTAVCTAICRRRGESAGSITGIADLEGSGKGRERICPDLRK